MHAQSKQQKAVTILTGTLVTVFLLFIFLFPTVTHAQGDNFGLTQFGQSTLLGGGDIRIIIGRLVQVGLSLLGVVAVGFVLYGGYQIMTSAGNQDKVTAGKKILTNAVIGIVIILSSLAIVQFVIVRVQGAILGGDGAGGGGGVAGPGAGGFNTFFGSGSLGRIVRDHVPARNATGVARNTSIAVTFNQGIDPTSLINDVNGTGGGIGNGIFGDCVTPQGQAFNAATDCDQINTDVVRIYRTGDEANRLPATAAALQGAGNEFFTFVFRPLENLGNDDANVDYTVELTNAINLTDGQTSAFANDRDGRYVWRFETGTEVDFTPPSVVSTYPANGAAIPRNHIVQINFTEPIDPVSFSPTLNNVILNTQTLRQPTGEWRFSNGYRTVEYISDVACGRNSCGDQMFCLPVDCADPNDLACRTDATGLVRTAAVIDQNSTSFQSVPFTGVMDFAGNALDSGPNRGANGVLVADGNLANPHKPALGDPTQIGAAELAPDNAWWTFSILNQIDTSAPHIQSITPNVDAQNVPGDTPVEITFNQPVIVNTLFNMSITEFPVLQNVAPLWFVPRYRTVDVNGQTLGVATVNHREFGPNDTDRYYFPVIPSSVRGINQNCMYPGRGPVSAQANQAPTCNCETSPAGVVTCTGQCVPDPAQPLDPNADTACVQTTLQQENGNSLLLQPNVATCLTTLQRADISPPPAN